MKRFLIILFVFSLLLAASYMLSRDYFLEKAILKVQERVRNKYNAELIISAAKFSGLTGINLTGISLIPSRGDTLFNAGEAAINLSLIRYLQGNPPVNSILLSFGFVRLREYADSTSNFSSLLQKDTLAITEQDTDTTNINYRKQVRRLWNRFFSLADFNFSLTDFFLEWQAPDYREQLEIESLKLENSFLTFIAADSTAGQKNKWLVNGVIDPDKEIIRVEGETAENKMGEIPFFKKLSRIKIMTRKFAFSVLLDDDNSESIDFKIMAATYNPAINHWRISPEDVLLDSLLAQFYFKFRDNEIIAGKGSGVVVNQVRIDTYFRYYKNDSTVVTANLDIANTPAQNFFNSLPRGLFSTLEGIKVKGELSYKLVFNANLSDPENLVFDSGLQKKNFRITGYGNENFESINGTFTHTVREKERIVRNIKVGPENPSYIPLEYISPLLVNCVLTAEDGTFRFHKGFNEEAFRQSIATNIKEKRFARGGSTITMQLVKNVFLNRNKTISRKVEEALIVWMIENNYLVSKERMLEVYLNIIEWGPNVYGISEASLFYFNKHPASLSLEESIYLSSIIPKPKTFRYTFDKEGKMKEYLKGYFDLVAGRLLKKEIISQSVFDSLKYQVELKGPALQLVLPADSMPADSLLIEEQEELF